MITNHSISPELEELIETETSVKKFLVIHNDDHNTFDFVIECLIEVCDHDVIQAEQCTNIIHYKGKCDVKKGDIETLLPLRRELNRRGLTATID